MKVFRKSRWSLISIFTLAVVNRAILTAIPAYSEGDATNPHETNQYSGSDQKPTSPIEVRDGCEYVPQNPDDRESPNVQTCQALAAAVAGYVAGHYAEKALNWVDAKVTNAYENAGRDNGRDNSGSSGSGDSHADAAANSGDAYHGRGGVARNTNSLWQPEANFDPQ